MTHESWWGCEHKSWRALADTSMQEPGESCWGCEHESWLALVMVGVGTLVMVGWGAVACLPCYSLPPRYSLPY